jgi:FkbM family methyltransferase
VFDVGAHVGFFSVFSSVLAEGGRVLAIEPNPLNVALLERTVEANCDLEIAILPKAAGHELGWIEFVTYEAEGDVHNPSLLGRIGDVASLGKGSRVRVEMVTLDSVAVSHNLWPDVVKIDTEGAEALILDGMQHILSQANPVLIVELHNEIAERASMELLANYGYLVSPLSEPPNQSYPFHVIAARCGRIA